MTNKGNIDPLWLRLVALFSCIHISEGKNVAVIKSL